MIYLCADDYGISNVCNRRIEQCIRDGALNRISVLPNGEISELKRLLLDESLDVSLHINLVEGFPLSHPKDIPMLVADDGCFKHSFIGLFFHSFSKQRKTMEQQLYTELRSQIRFWKMQVGEDTPVVLDSHQHVCMIPLIFKTLVKVIKDENVNVRCMRVPAEPVLPYILTPSLYHTYSITNLIKQWLLKILAFMNRKEIKKLNVKPAYFMGALFSGRLDEVKIKKVLPRYIKCANKHGRDIEIAFHPGYLEDGEHLMNGSRDGFRTFYDSPWRRIEYDTLMNLKF